MGWGCLKAKASVWVGVSFVAPSFCTSEESLIHFFSVNGTPQGSEELSWLLLWLFSQPLVMHDVLQPPYQWLSSWPISSVLEDTKLDVCPAATQMGIIISANVVLAILLGQPSVWAALAAARVPCWPLPVPSPGSSASLCWSSQPEWPCGIFLHCCKTVFVFAENCETSVKAVSSLSWSWGAAVLHPTTAVLPKVDVMDLQCCSGWKRPQRSSPVIDPALPGPPLDHVP